MTLNEKLLEGLGKGWELEDLKRIILKDIVENITEARLRNGILNDIRQDAYKKIKFANEEESGLLIDAALYIITLAKLARKEGLLYLEYFIEYLPEHLQTPIQMIVDAWPFEEIAEIATNDYWSRDPQGIQAMISYIYIRGANYIQKGYSPDAIKNELETLFPLNWRQEYREKCKKMKITEIFPKYASI